MPDPAPQPPAPSDATLLARAERGDEAAFAALYHRYRDWCVRVARRFTRDDAAAWDATHDAFAWFLRSLPRLHLDGRLGSLLYPALKNAALTAARKQAVHDRHAPAIAASRPNDPAHPPHDIPSCALRAALDALPDGQREVLLMRTIDGLSTDETAQALGIPAGTVKSRLHHALAALRADDQLRALLDS